MDRPNLHIVGPDDEPPPSAWPPFFSQWVLPYLREPALFPVLLAVLGHVMVVLAPLMLAVARSGSWWAATLLVLFAALSLLPLRWEWLDLGRPGGVTLIVALTWAASVAAAWFGGQAGYL